MKPNKGPISGTFNRDASPSLSCGCVLTAEDGTLAIEWCLTHAAAPELLAAIKELMLEVDEAGMHQDCEPECSWSIARAAIRKAEGRA